MFVPGCLLHTSRNLLCWIASSLMILCFHLSKITQTHTLTHTCCQWWRLFLVLSVDSETSTVCCFDKDTSSGSTEYVCILCMCPLRCDFWEGNRHWCREWRAEWIRVWPWQMEKGISLTTGNDSLEHVLVFTQPTIQCARPVCRSFSHKHELKRQVVTHTVWNVTRKSSPHGHIESSVSRHIQSGFFKQCGEEDFQNGMCFTNSALFGCLQGLFDITRKTKLFKTHQDQEPIPYSRRNESRAGARH